MQKRIGILRGGAGDNYHHSLKKGGEIIAHISENLGDKYKTVDILIDKDGIWHVAGRPAQLSDLMHRVDMVWNVAHANFSHSLDSLAIPHLSPAPFFSALMESKDLLKEHLKKIGIKLPRSIVLPAYQADFDGPKEQYAVKKAREVFEKFSSPWVVKSFTEDKSMGIHLTKIFPELIEAIEDGVAHGDSILVEEFIGGRVATTHCVPGFRGRDVYIFPVGDRVGTFGPIEKEKLATLSEDLYRHIGGKHYIKADFVLDPRGKVYLLQMESEPDLRAGSHFAEACEAIGAKMHHIVEHMLERTLS
jgi:D-alanine-D-alanine ligase